MRSLIRLCLVLLCSFFFLTLARIFTYPIKELTVHIVPRIQKCVSGLLCNSLGKLSLQTFYPSTKFKKTLTFLYILQEKNSVYVLLYAGAYFAGLKEYDAYSFLAILFLSFFCLFFFLQHCLCCTLADGC